MQEINHFRPLESGTLADLIAFARQGLYKSVYQAIDIEWKN